jgi:hypothetical protein
MAMLSHHNLYNGKSDIATWPIAAMAGNLKKRRTECQSKLINPWF